MVSAIENRTKNYLLKVIIDGEVQEFKNFGKDVIEVLDNMVDIPIVQEVLEIEEKDTGKNGQEGSLKPLKEIKSKIKKIEGA